MKDFFKFTFASCLGMCLAGVVLFFWGSVKITSAVAGMVGGEEVAPSTNPNSVLNVTLELPVPEKTNNIENSQFGLKMDDVLGIHDIVRSIRFAKNDDNIQGLMINMNSMSIGQANASYLRRTIENFKESGKFVLAYSSAYSTGSYYVASAADKVYINPFSVMQFDGFSATIPFFKGMLDKLGVKMQVKYAGQFKSATEPFRRYDMSDQNKLQVRAYLEGMYKVYLDDIAASRNMTPAQLRDIADAGILLQSKEAVESGLVDAAKYMDEVLEEVRERLGLGQSAKIPTVELYDYADVAKAGKDYSSSNKIAVVYAEGTIVDGEGGLGSIGGDSYARIIRKARQDDNVKAIVLRVNSGGGSGMASENIWREIELAKADGKTVVTSMGDVAASGGYYIACNSDAIFAQPNTITGSIGVFAMIPSWEKGMKEHLGITVDTVKTTRFSTNITPFFDLSQAEGDEVQKYIDNFYDHFLKRVTESRATLASTEDTHEIAQGRVWTGEKALEIGLVDKLGTLDEAIAFAADKAGIPNYRLKEFPQVKEPIQQFLDEFMGNDGKEPLAKAIVDHSLEAELGAMYPHVKALKEMMQTQGVQARMPYIINF
ncbi:MAG: signal peptide peptidase SppA, partial [Bacteroidota bacterium]